MTKPTRILRVLETEQDRDVAFRVPRSTFRIGQWMKLGLWFFVLLAFFFPECTYKESINPTVGIGAGVFGWGVFVHLAVAHWPIRWAGRGMVSGVDSLQIRRSFPSEGDRNPRPLPRVTLNGALLPDSEVDNAAVQIGHFEAAFLPGVPQHYFPIYLVFGQRVHSLLVFPDGGIRRRLRGANSARGLAQRIAGGLGVEAPASIHEESGWASRLAAGVGWWPLAPYLLFLTGLIVWYTGNWFAATVAAALFFSTYDWILALLFRLVFRNRFAQMAAEIRNRREPPSK